MIYNMSGPPALVPTSPWFGDGSDGDLVITADYPIEVQEDIGHIFKQYTSLHIQSGGTLRPSARCAGMVILVQGDCTIDAGGSINMDKMAPRRSDDTEAAILTTGPSAPWLQKISGLVGGAGGKGGDSRGASASAIGYGGNGGPGHRFGGGYGGGGAGIYGLPMSGLYNATNGGSSDPRPDVSIRWPYKSGSGNGLYGSGGGGYLNGDNHGGAAPGGGGTTQVGDLIFNGLDGDAYGGGALMIVVGGTATINGTITADGGDGGDCGARSSEVALAGGGGGGGGGLIVIYYKNTNVLQGSIGAAGGSGGSGSYQNGTNGSTGTTHISQVDDELNEI